MKKSTDTELSPEICLYVKKWVKEHSEEIHKYMVEEIRKNNFDGESLYSFPYI